MEGIYKQKNLFQEYIWIWAWLIELRYRNKHALLHTKWSIQVTFIRILSAKMSYATLLIITGMNDDDGDDVIQ